MTKIASGLSTTLCVKVHFLSTIAISNGIPEVLVCDWWLLTVLAFLSQNPKIRSVLGEKASMKTISLHLYVPSTHKCSITHHSGSWAPTLVISVTGLVASDTVRVILTSDSLHNSILLLSEHCS